jgi:uncharacterized BrkB/YihY/UPF0761 family membrane protein
MIGEYELNRIIALVAVVVLSFTVGVLTMIYGWGLHPRSWSWIIGGAFAVALLAALVQWIMRA